MGRGRKGIINQTTKKLVPRRRHNIAMFLGRPDKSDETKKIPVPEHVVDFMKNMNPQELVDFLSLNEDDWHVKTSSGNASGN